MRGFELKEFKKYTIFLLESPAILQQLTNYYFLKVRKSEIPLLQFFSHLSTEEFKKTTDESILNFLRQVQEDKALAQALQSLENWKADNLPGIPKEKVAIHDIVKVYTLRKLLLLDFLPEYTTDVSLFAAITKELELFHSFIEERAFQTYVDIQQEALFRQKEFATSLVHHSVDGILAFDKELRITEWNPVMEQWYQQSKDEVLGKRISESLSHFKDQLESAALLAVLKGEHIYIRERAFTKRPGYYELNIKPLYDMQGTVTGGVCTFHDSNHRRAAEGMIHEKNQELATALEELTATEEQLREINEELERRVAERTQELTASEEVLRQTMDKMIDLHIAVTAREDFLNNVIEQSPVSTWIADANGTMIQINQACLELFGFHHPAFSLSNYNILKDEVLQQMPYYADIVAVFERGEVAHFEANYETNKLQYVAEATNTSLFLLATVFPIKNTEGKVTHVVIQHENMTASRRAELALQASEEQLRLLTDSLPVLISYIDTDRRYRFVNQAYVDWFKRPKQAVRDQKVRDVIGEKAYQNVVQHLDRALAGQEVFFETRQDYGQFGSRYISCNFIPHVVGEEVKGIYALATDISERKVSEQKLKKLYGQVQQRNKELKRINTDLDNFVYMASHDLKAPVANLEGLLNMLQAITSQAEGKAVRTVQMMQLSISKLKTTIEDLVEITRVQKQMEQQAFETINFMQIIDDVKTDLQPLIRESNAEIKEDYAVATINYPKSHLRSIIYNLLSNALKYRSPDRKAVVCITTSGTHEQVMLSVQDNGLGLDHAQQQKLFTMFKRMHPHIEGTGIGLYTIKRIIENNAGEIRVHSGIDQGTEFTIRF